MKKLAISAVFAVLASPWAAQAQSFGGFGFGGFGGWGGGGHPQVSAPEMPGYAMLVAGMLGLAGYLALRRRYAQAK